MKKSSPFDVLLLINREIKPSGALVLFQKKVLRENCIHYRNKKVNSAPWIKKPQRRWSVGKGKAVHVLNEVQCHGCLTNHHTMKTHGGVEVWLHTFLNLVLDGGEWSTSCPSCFTPRERAPSTNLIGGWVGHKGCMVKKLHLLQTLVLEGGGQSTSCLLVSNLDPKCFPSNTSTKYCG
jgi:hypothetical protein